MKTLTHAQMQEITGGDLKETLCGISVGLTFAEMLIEGPFFILHAAATVVICSQT
jgi:bacteriocin-like protein